ncbi:MAG: hypothetical protein CO117_10370 [Flavobacteriaceae bacterium CG_4_9_14_3_um_filter_33_16]|nr:MAG: hypothetical protein CO117_10370 [Flavobacteriaceae bacterium CG_4_9_14_3_um_filter_33_16]
MRREFITNIYNPKLPDAINHLVKNDDEKRKQELFNYMIEKIKELEIGDPQETETKSVEELKAMDIVGLYSGPNTSRYVFNFFAGEEITKKNLYEPENVIVDAIEPSEKITKVEIDIDY